jgi:ribosome-binding protein aMBF1 (putative translation factor)
VLSAIIAPISNRIHIEVKRAEIARKMNKSKPCNLVGNRVKEARLKHKPVVSQNDLAGRLAAKEIPLDRTVITKIENRTRKVSDYELVAIARALKVTVAWLLGE